MKKQHEENQAHIDILTKRLNCFEEKLESFKESTIKGILNELETSAPFDTNQFFT